MKTHPSRELGYKRAEFLSSGLISNKDKKEKELARRLLVAICYLDASAVPDCLG